MIIPSIDLMGGQAVQLIGGKEKALEAGDPLPIAEKFKLAGEIAVIDLDAALGQGSNEELIRKLVRVAPCRVGGGIRDVAAAQKWLDAGAAKIIIGTRAVPELLRELPKERVIAALDAEHGEVVVEGWQQKTGRKILDRLAELRGLVGGFLVTFVEHEGRMMGTPMEKVGQLVRAANGAQLTIAGGITTAHDVADLAHLGADAQVGMALYTERLRLADAIVAPLESDKMGGFWPTVVCDEHGTALGFVWSSLESVRKAVELRRGVYQSRSRGIWIKGETSGATQELLRIDLDCDHDALRFVVRQHGAGFCHLNRRTCWGEGQGLPQLFRKLKARLLDAPDGSYTRRLLDDQAMLHAKLLEEARELTETKNADEAKLEAADVLYFTLVKMVQSGVSLEDVERELDWRTLKISRRPGLVKESKE